MRAPSAALGPLVLALAALQPGCDALWSAFRVPHDGPCVGDRVCKGATFPVAPVLDLLFVIDNSPLMRPKQTMLLDRVGPLFERLERLGVEYHAAVVSTDVGSWPAGQSLPAFRGCGSAAGDDGAMQGAACSTRALSPEGMAACLALCPDASFVPGWDIPFIGRGRGGGGNFPRSIVAGVDQGPARTFQCIAMLGDTGCDIEGPFEAMRRALDGHSRMNEQFLHPGGALAVIFLTDEDDCSVQASQRGVNDPAARLNCATGAGGDYRCYNPDYRCFAQNVTCSEPLNTTGTKTGCQERPSSYLEPLETYAGFLKGLRPAHKLLVAGVWPPRLGAADSRLVVSTEPGGSAADSFDLNRGSMQTDASCSYVEAGQAVTGRPQLRLSRFLSQFAKNVEVDMCSTADYGAGILRIGAKLQGLLTECLDFVPAQQDGAPLCLVGDIARGQTAPAAPMAPCSAPCCTAWAVSHDPAPPETDIIVACQGEAADCYCAIESQSGVCPGGAVAGVVRKGPPPEDSVLSFTCAAQ